MAALHVAQVAYLAQDLIEHLKNANNLIMRSKYELDHIRQIAKMLCTVQEEFERDWDYVQKYK